MGGELVFKFPMFLSLYSGSWESHFNLFCVLGMVAMSFWLQRPNTKKRITRCSWIWASIARSVVGLERSFWPTYLKCRRSRKSMERFQLGDHICKPSTKYPFASEFIHLPSHPPIHPWFYRFKTYNTHSHLSHVTSFWSGPDSRTAHTCKRMVKQPKPKPNKAIEQHKLKPRWIYTSK